MPKEEAEPDPMPPESRNEVDVSPATGSATQALPPDVISMMRTAGMDPADPQALSRVLQIGLYSGPLPFVAPPILAEYEAHFPGLANKLVEWTEVQREHRQGLERLRAERSERRLDRGQIGGVAVALLGLGLSTVTGIFGSATVASIMAIVSVGGPTAAILLARGKVTGSGQAPRRGSQSNQ